MQTAEIKYDIISWITRLNDEKTILELKKFVNELDLSVNLTLPKQQGSLTKSFGIWDDDAPFDETNYRDILWQTEKNVW